MPVEQTHTIPTNDSVPESKLRQRSLQAAGYAYLAGDAALFSLGMITGDKGPVVAGAVFAAGGIAAAKYGHPDTERQCEQVKARLRDHLSAQGIGQADLAPLLRQRHPGLLGHLRDVIASHPSETLNLAYGLGGACMIHGGIHTMRENTQKIAQQLEPSKGMPRLNVAQGALITAGALAGLVLPEQASEQKKPLDNFAGPVSRVGHWFAEKPLRISSALYSASNASVMAVSAWKMQHPDPAVRKAALASFLMTTSYLFANTMLGLTSKDGNHSLTPDALSVLADHTAAVIAAQPTPLQESLIADASHYLAAQPEATRTAEQISSLLHRKLNEAGQAHPSPAADWQAKIAAREPATQSLT